jgi:U32 family peptidase
MTIPELLAPAGNLEKLKMAVHYGADAVYLGGKAFGLRRLADNFTLEEMAEGVSHAHDRGVRVYLTLNSYLRNGDFPALADYLAQLAPIPFDAYIAADPGVIDLIRETAPDRAIHLSTQANTVNWRSARFWRRQGVSRVNLARELSLAEIGETAAHAGLEVEAFGHGAMCISYSGRCLLSSVMAGRDANQGECAHPCRWRYALVEETRPGEYFPIEENNNGTFIFNSRDLCLIEYLPELAAAGVSALKIEGRMKGIHYVASTVRVYREALDRLRDEGAAYRFRPEWLEELCKVSHRGYTTGFLLGQPRDVAQEYHSRYLRSHDLVGVVETVAADGTAVIGVRNRLAVGETLELIGPQMKSEKFPLATLADSDGTLLSAANPNQRVRMVLPPGAAPLDLLRRGQQ